MRELYYILPIFWTEGECFAPSIPSTFWAVSIFVAAVLVLIPIAAPVHLFRYVFATLLFTEIYVFGLLIFRGSFEFQFIWHPAILLIVSLLGLLYFHLPSTTKHFKFPRQFNLSSYIISAVLGIGTLVLIDMLDGLFCPEEVPFIYFQF